MALRDLTSETMTVISRAWLDPAKERPLLLGLSRVAPLVVDLQIAHDDLVAHQQPPPKVAPELAALNRRVAELDALHDRLARGVHSILEGLVELADDPDQSEAWRQVQAELFPQGRAITRRSYLDQAGEASRIEARLSVRSQQLLQCNRFNDRPLIDYVREWQEAGLALGEAEQERILLAKEDPSKPSVGKVRNAWISAVNAILAMLNREPDLSEADRRRILEPLETALAKAEAKKRAKTVVEAKEEGADETKAEAG